VLPNQGMLQEIMSSETHVAVQGVY